jgi:hypothetical protein
MDAASQHQIKTPEEAGEFPFMPSVGGGTEKLHELEITCYSAEQLSFVRADGASASQSEQEVLNLNQPSLPRNKTNRLLMRFS